MAQVRFPNRGPIIDEANKKFDRLGKLVNEAVASGAKTLDLHALLAKADIDVSKEHLDQSHIPNELIPITFLPWTQWFPWEAVWVSYLQKRFPEAHLVGHRASLAGMPAPMP